MFGKITKKEIAIGLKFQPVCTVLGPSYFRNNMNHKYLNNILLIHTTTGLMTLFIMGLMHCR
jgi:hypothetical protein